MDMAAMAPAGIIPAMAMAVAGTTLDTAMALAGTIPAMAMAATITGTPPATIAAMATVTTATILAMVATTALAAATAMVTMVSTPAMAMATAMVTGPATPATATACAALAATLPATQAHPGQAALTRAVSVARTIAAEFPVPAMLRASSTRARVPRLLEPVRVRFTKSERAG